MPAALAQPLAWSAPLANSALPFPLFVNGTELSGGTSGADALTMRLRDPGFSGPQILTFTIHDHTLSVWPWIAKQQRVLWHDSANNRVLFQGAVTDLHAVTHATWLDIEVTCTHVGQALDYAQPITTWDSGQHGPSDQAMIQCLLANFAMEPQIGAGGWVQLLDASVGASVPNDRATLRNAIAQVQAASGVTGAVAYVDNYGLLHTMAVGDIAAPYTITDTPNYTTSVPARVELLDQGSPDVDALYVYGATAAASGPVLASACGISAFPASPLRWATLDAPGATDGPGMIAAATLEFQRRQNAVTVTLTVGGDAQHGEFDGWAKGQLVTVTNAALGWSGRQLTISAVDMDVISGKGSRRYAITAGSDPVLFTARLKMMQARGQSVAVNGAALRGRLGGALS